MACISEVAGWMKSNRLRFNSAKTDFVWFTSPRRLGQLDSTSFTVGTDIVQPSHVVRNLGLQLDNGLSLSPHITRVVRTCFSILRQLRSVMRSLPREVARQLVQSFVLSHIDYCNATFAGLPQRDTDRLQAVINAAARLIGGVRKYDHITPFLRDNLHTLKVRERIQFKICLLVFKCLHNQAPRYLQEHVHLLADDQRRQRLRSSKSLDVLVPFSRTGSGDRSFRVAAPRAWNTLPSIVQEASSLTSFKKLLKTHLFSLSYPIV